ncbi:TonB-dependent receptor [Halothiobacillus sp. DCM-1]|uniref:TonB-dependent receptor n=1 Tax=Halothiobacillus sp. DCM-1 TaxID=3112558 RepID=UPI00324E3906
MSRHWVSVAVLSALGVGVSQADSVVDLGQIAIDAPPSVVGMPGEPTVVRAGASLFTHQDGGTLGAALAGLPGLDSTWYGPNSNRPIVRGLDGHRVAILTDGMPSLDASAVSYDHNAPVNPLSLNKIEVLRGPAALRYSGGAAGGVIAAEDDAIALRPVNGVSGRVQLQGDTASRRLATATSVDAGNGLYALHVDGFASHAGDYAAPGGYRGGSWVDGRIDNSGSAQRGGTLGFSLTGDQGAVGFSIGQTRDRYGVIVDPATTIDMRSTQYAFKAERRQVADWLNSVQLSANHTNYQHQELDNGVPATTFLNRGNSLRLALNSDALGMNWDYGLQYTGFQFSALGDESFLPVTHTRQWSGFAVGQGAADRWHYSLGLRGERVSVSSDGEGASGVARFGAAQTQTSTPISASLSVAYEFAPNWQAIATLSHNERAPAFDELYANGPHDATAAYELGDPTLSRERSHTLEAGLRWEAGEAKFSTTGYISQYQNFIGLMGTDRCRDGDGLVVACDAADALPEFDYQGVRARLVGVELSAQHPLADWGAQKLSGRLTANILRADNLTAGEPLPRIAPYSFTPALIWQMNPSVSVELNAVLAARQTRVPATDTAGATPGYALVNLKASGSLAPVLGTQAVGALWYVSLDNLTNRTAYAATSIDTMRLLAPKPGRSLGAGVQLVF